MISTHLLCLCCYCCFSPTALLLMFVMKNKEKKTSQAFFWLSVIWVYLESCEAVSSAASVVMFS